MGKREGGNNKRSHSINRVRQSCSYDNCENGLTEDNDHRHVSSVSGKYGKDLHVASDCISGKFRDVIGSLCREEENGLGCKTDNSCEVWCICRVIKPCVRCRQVKGQPGPVVSPLYIQTNANTTAAANDDNGCADDDSEPTTPTPELDLDWETDVASVSNCEKGHIKVNGEVSNRHANCVNPGDSLDTVETSPKNTYVGSGINGEASNGHIDTHVHIDGFRQIDSQAYSETGKKFGIGYKHTNISETVVGEKCVRSIADFEKDVNEFSEAAVNDLQDLFDRLDALNSVESQCEGQCRDTCTTGQQRDCDGSGAATPIMDNASTCSFDHFDFDTSFCSLKSTDMMEQGDLADQLSLVQQMVVEMKTGFTRAMEELSKIQYGDQSLQEQLADSKKQCGQEIDGVRQAVEELKTEVKTLCSKMQDITEAQKSLQERVDNYQTDKNMLLEELERHGAISEQVRLRLGQGSPGAQPLTQDGTPDVAPMVHPYLNSLQNHHRGTDEYQSDSSLTAAVSRSLNLTQALGEQCLNLDQSTSSDDDDDDNSRHSQTDSGHNKPSRRHGSLHREEATRDIVEAEREYCSQIWALLEDFVNPLRDEEIMGRRDLNQLFPSYIPHIYEQHCIILRKLEERLKKWKRNGVVGDVFAKFTDSQDGDGLSLYKDFINDFPNVITAMNKWFSHSPHFRQLMQSQCLANAPVLPLLLAPLQQVPKYSLLLKNLLKYTPVDHPDRYYLESSLTRLKHFLVNMNDDLEHAMQVINNGGQHVTRSRETGHSARSRSSGSSGEVNHKSHDSGVHSNEEEKDKAPMSPNTTRRYLLQLLRDKREQDGPRTGVRAPSPRTREKHSYGSHPDLSNQPPGYQDGRMSPYLSSLSPSQKFSSLSKLPLPKDANKRSRSHRIQDNQRPQINTNYLRPLTPQVFPTSTSAHSFDSARRREEYSDRLRARPASAMEFGTSQDQYLELMAQQAALTISPPHSTSSDRSRRDLQLSLQKLLAETNNQDGEFSDNEQQESEPHLSSYHDHFLASKERIHRLSQQVNPTSGLGNSNPHVGNSKGKRRTLPDYPKEDFGIYGDDDEDDENEQNQYEHETCKPMRLLPDNHRPKIMVPRWRQNASPLPPSYLHSTEHSNKNGFTSEENLAASLAQSLLDSNKKASQRHGKETDMVETNDRLAVNKGSSLKRQAKIPESPRRHQQGSEDDSPRGEIGSGRLNNKSSLDGTSGRPAELNLNHSNSSSGTNNSYGSNTLPKRSSESSSGIPKRHSVERLTDVIAFTADCIEKKDRPSESINKDNSPIMKSSIARQVDSPSGKLDISKILSDNNMKVSSVDALSPAEPAVSDKQPDKELRLPFSTSPTSVADKTTPSLANTESLVHYFQNRSQINQNKHIPGAANPSFLDNKTSTPVHEHKPFGDSKTRESFNSFVKKESARLTREDEVKPDSNTKEKTDKSVHSPKEPKSPTEIESGLRPLDKLRMSFEKQKQLSEERKQAQIQNSQPPEYDTNSNHKPTIQRQFNEISATVKKADSNPRSLKLRTFSSSNDDQDSNYVRQSSHNNETNGIGQSPETPEPKMGLYKKGGPLKSPTKFQVETSASARQIQKLERSVSPTSRPERNQSPNSQSQNTFVSSSQYDKFKNSVLAKPATRGTSPHRASGETSFIPQRSYSPSRSRASLERDRPKSTTELGTMSVDRTVDTGKDASTSQLKSAMRDTKIPVLRKSSGHISKSSEDISKIKKKPAFKDQLKNIFSRKKRRSKLYEDSDYDSHFVEESSFQHVDHVDDILSFPLSSNRKAKSTSNILHMYMFEDDDDDDYDDVISPV